MDILHERPAGIRFIAAGSKKVNWTLAELVKGQINDR